MYTIVDSCIYTYVNGSTGKYAVANTVVEYAYNTWYPCTLCVHVYTQYLYIYAMNIQSSTYPLVPCWYLDPYHSSTVQPAQEVWLPSGQLWHCSSRWLAWQHCHCVWGEPVGVAVWVWQATPGWSVSWKDWCQEGLEEAAQRERRNQQGFSWQAVSQELPVIQYYRVLNVINLKLYNIL